MKIYYLYFLCFLLASGCSSTPFRSPSSDQGPAGEAGEAGSAGTSGKGGSIHTAIQPFPLCEAGQEIINARDSARLQEFLAAGCSATDIPPQGTDHSLFDGVVVNRYNELLKILLQNSQVRKNADLYSKVHSIPPIDRLSVELNPFEIAIYDYIFDDLETGHDESKFRNLYVDQNQLTMLSILLDAATDSDKLRQATAMALVRLKKSSYADRPQVQEAIALIENRLNSLSQ